MDAKHKMERFAKIVNSYKPLSICAKRSILDVGQSSEYATGHLLTWKNKKV